MTLGEIIADYRALAFDNTEPYLCPRDLAVVYANQGQLEGCRRGHLIKDAASPLCEVEFQGGDADIAIDKRIIRINGATINGSAVAVLDASEVDCAHLGWQTSNAKGHPTALVQGLSAGRAHLWPVPTVPGIIRLRVERLPLRPMAHDSDQPEIRWESHQFLANWIAYKVFSRADSDMFDPSRAQEHYREFQSEFGERHGVRNEEWTRSGNGLLMSPIA